MRLFLLVCLAVANGLPSAQPAAAADVKANTIKLIVDYGDGVELHYKALAYKPNIDDVRETPAAEIIDLLEDLGAEVSYHDPLVPAFPHMRRHQRDLRSVPATPERLRAEDCVVIVTNHDCIDYTAIATHARLVVDTRNALRNLRGLGARIVKA